MIPREEVVLGERLGSGASGDVYAALYRRHEVAVKVCDGDSALNDGCAWW